MHIAYDTGRCITEVVEVAERFDEVDGKFPLIGTVVVYRSDDQTFHSLLHGVRIPAGEVRGFIDNLPTQATHIPSEAYAPVFPVDGSLSIAPNSLSANIFTKRPSLTSFDRYLHQDRPNDIAKAVLSEARVCEILKHNPHPNIAEYHGCEVSKDGRITGLCWTKLGDSLMQRVNPEFTGKRIFTFKPGSLGDKDGILEKVKAGVQHLHRLGLAHNDINPSNILFDKDDNPVIIDFNSCTPIGHSLKGIGRTYQWHDENVCIASPSNDLDALEEIREWLREGGELKSFRFD